MCGWYSYKIDEEKADNLEMKNLSIGCRRFVRNVPKLDNGTLDNWIEKWPSVIV